MAFKIIKFVTTCLQGYSIEILDTGYTTGDREVTEHTHVQDKSTYDKAINIITICLKYCYALNIVLNRPSVKTIKKFSIYIHL